MISSMNVSDNWLLSAEQLLSSVVTNIETEHSLGHTFAAGFPISIAFHEARHYGKNTNNQVNGFRGVCVQHRKTDPKVTKIE